MYSMEASISSSRDVIWSNQKRFNSLEFQFESLFPALENLPDRPNYIHDSGFGIVHSQIQVNVSKMSRSGKLVYCMPLCHEVLLLFQNI